MRAGLLCAVLGLAGCATRPSPRAAIAPGDEITLYRDRALITQRVVVDVPPASLATLTVQVAADTTVHEVIVLDRGNLRVLEVRGPHEPAAPGTRPSSFRDDDDPDGELDLLDEPEPPLAPPPAPPAGPASITFVVSAPRAGRYALRLGYVTDRLRWDAAYTLTTTPERARATLRGAIAIRNTSGVRFARTRVFVVDAELGAWRGRIADQLGSALAGTRSTGTPIAEPRALGTLELGTGETHIELLAGDPPRRMRSVLVYDPIGTKLDHGGAAPIRAPSLGLEQPSARVTESFEIVRPRPTSEGLPGGPVRLLERRARGALIVLGESRLFDISTRVASADTIAVGIADGVTGHRERRELTIDDDAKRLVEEFVVTIANARARAIEVVLREHLYRGQNWTLAYQTASAPRKEGPQQISLRMSVPANSERKVLYVVVYTWP